MEVKQAEFVVSNSSVSKCPDSIFPEYAFIGRSNVGKSSLINMLTNHKGLAKVSGRPGKTQLINHFLINKSWYLVDLPGYGYAQVSKSSKRVFQKFITDYFSKRKQMVSAFVLIDIRHRPQPIDLEFMRWLAESSVPFSIVFTKADKLPTTQQSLNIASYKSLMLESWQQMPTYFVTSSDKKMGREALLSYIDKLNKMANSNR